MLMCPQCGQSNPIVELAGPGHSRSKKRRVQHCRICGFTIVHANTGINKDKSRGAGSPRKGPRKDPKSAPPSHHGIPALEVEDALGSVTSVDAEPIYPAMR